MKKVKPHILRFILIWFFVCATHICIADSKHINPHRYDGSDWITWTADRKLGFIHGIRAGVYLSSYILWEKNSSANKMINPLLEQDIDQQISVIEATYKNPAKKIAIRGEFIPVRQVPIAVVWRLSVEGKL